MGVAPAKIIFVVILSIEVALLLNLLQGLDIMNV